MMTAVTQASNFPVRMGPVEGFCERKNDIIYCLPDSQDLIGTILFFGGDMQDYKENMLAHRDNKYYSEWDLESTAALLHKNFPDYLIVIVKASKMSLNTFSCYENFVEVNNFGAPTYSINSDALMHLKLLLQNLSASNTSHFFPSNLIDKCIMLIGFSKGCVVLNQLLYSIHSLTLAPNEELKSFLKNIKILYWIDGGHSGTSDTWITNRTVLESFVKSNIEVHIHVTPYQVHCDTRPRIGKEEKLFREILKKMGVRLHRKLYFEDEPKSLDYHFKVLQHFHESC